MILNAVMTNLDRFPESIRPAAERYAASVRELASENAKALTFFGAVAAGANAPAPPYPIRNVLVLGEVDLKLLCRIGEQGAKFGKDHITAPIIMTPRFIGASLDTFPLELLEIQQAHITAFGDEHFNDLSFDDKNIRLQCERELKVMLVGMRQGLLASGGKGKFVGALELDIGEGLMRTLRGLLWLKGDREVKAAREVLIAVEKLASRELRGVRSSVDPAAPHGWEQFELLYRDIEHLGAVADAW
jgi:hypothetical protein